MTETTVDTDPAPTPPDDTVRVAISKNSRGAFHYREMPCVDRSACGKLAIVTAKGGHHVVHAVVGSGVVLGPAPGFADWSLQQAQVAMAALTRMHGVDWSKQDALKERRYSDVLLALHAVDRDLLRMDDPGQATLTLMDAFRIPRGGS